MPGLGDIYAPPVFVPFEIMPSFFPVMYADNHFGGIACYGNPLYNHIVASFDNRYSLNQYCPFTGKFFYFMIWNFSHN